MERKNVVIYTDGSCLGNKTGAPGGWCAIITLGKHEKVLSGRSKETTNNRMELTAVVEAVSALTEPCNVTVATDSTYVMMTNDTWKKWQSTKRHIPNWDLWLQLIEAGKKGHHKIGYAKVAAHSGHEYNERCDFIAKCQALEAQKGA